MPAEDFTAVIDSIAPFVEKHKSQYGITGGEPLVRQDLETVGWNFTNVSSRGALCLTDYFSLAVS